MDVFSKKTRLMRRFLWVLFCFGSFLFAQGNVTNTEYVEVQIVPSQTFTLENIEALPLSPGSEIEYFDNGSVQLQISAALAERLANDGVQIRVLREFILVQPVSVQDAIQPASATAFELAEQGVDVALSPSGWKYSYINYNGFPYPYTVIGIDVHYQVVVRGMADIDLTNESGSLEYNLEQHLFSSVNRTKTGITAFNGQPLAQVWALWGIDYYSYTSYIDYWWIKLYYDSGIDYCAALSYRKDYEYISRVVVGSIDNSTGSDGYTNYANLSTQMTIGTGYPITITNGEAYENDQCGIWVDWNHDNDFDDDGETITTAGAPAGPYTVIITPPADAAIGNTMMRVRIVDTSENALIPCGSILYGETEDYTINVITQPVGIAGDFVPPDGVDFADFSVLAKQWLLERLSFDTVPQGGDGVVNFLDFADFAENWQGDYAQLYGFANQWLQKGMYNADIAPLPNGDGVVDFTDLAMFAANWLAEI